MLQMICTEWSFDYKNESVTFLMTSLRIKKSSQMIAGRKCTIHKHHLHISPVNNQIMDEEVDPDCSRKLLVKAIFVETPY